MKATHILSLIVATLCWGVLQSRAQSLNWGNRQPQNPHLLSVGFGYEYGLTPALGYGYKLNVRTPVLFSANYSFPLGKQVVDDFKSTVGAQIRVLDVKHVGILLKAHGVFRRFGSSTVRMFNIGAEMGLTVGYFRPKWYLAAEANFDKAITTHLKNRSDDPYPVNGWYIPTAGNFLYGMQAGYSLKKNDFNLKLGGIVSQDFKATPLMPLYLQLSYCRYL